MTWKDVGQFVLKAAPALGGVLGGPAGAAAGEILAKALGIESTPDKVLDALKTDPSAIVKLKEIESNERVRLEELRTQAESAGVQADIEQIKTVNETFRTELSGSAGETWYQKAWRPACGFAVAIGSFVSVCFVSYLFYGAMKMHDTTAGIMQVTAQIPAFAMAISTILAIPGAAVGIAAWHRGKLQRDRVQTGEGQ